MLEAFSAALLEAAAGQAQAPAPDHEAIFPSLLESLIGGGKDDAEAPQSPESSDSPSDKKAEPVPNPKPAPLWLGTIPVPIPVAPQSRDCKGAGQPSITPSAALSPQLPPSAPAQPADPTSLINSPSEAPNTAAVSDLNAASKPDLFQITPTLSRPQGRVVKSGRPDAGKQSSPTKQSQTAITEPIASVPILSTPAPSLPPNESPTEALPPVPDASAAPSRRADALRSARNPVTGTVVTPSRFRQVAPHPDEAPADSPVNHPSEAPSETDAPSSPEILESLSSAPVRAAAVSQLAFQARLVPLETPPHLPDTQQPTLRIVSQKPEIPANVHQDTASQPKSPQAPPEPKRENREPQAQAQPEPEGRSPQAGQQPQSDSSTQAAALQAAPPSREMAQEATPAAPSRSEAPRPAEPVEPRTAPEIRQPAVRDIRLEVNGSDRRVEVRLTERAGEVHVAVRTPDSRLASDLRENLPSLSSRLEQSGFRADGLSHEGAASSSNTERHDVQHAAQHGTGDSDPRGRDSGGNQRDQQQQRDRQPQEPLVSKPKRKDFAWFLSTQL